MEDQYPNEIFIDKTKMATEGKPRYSPVLAQEREWIPVKDQLPGDAQPVLIRLLHPNDLSGEDEKYLFCLEDIMIGAHCDGNWYICPPFPKYDYSRLSNKQNINDGIEVTHWAVPKDTEIKGWDSRFDRIREYEKLVLEVDSKNEEDVYRALMWAGHFIAMAAGPDFNNKESDMRKWYEIICDLQNAIDQGVGTDEQNVSTDNG